MEKLEIEPNSEKIDKVEFMSIEPPKVPPTLEPGCSKKIKPRAIIFRSNNKDFDTIRKLIETQFSEVEILYVTTGPVASVLRVTKSIPFEMQNCSEQPNYTVE